MTAFTDVNALAEDRSGTLGLRGSRHNVESFPHHGCNGSSN